MNLRRDGAGKPTGLFAIIAIVLIGGTVFSRFANAGEVTPNGLSAGKEAGVGSNTGTVTRVRIEGDVAIGAGECAALRKIADALAKTPELPVIVEWTETYHHRSVEKQVEFLPDNRELRCSDNARIRYQYQPVNANGIQAAIANGGEAAFANANLYSLSQAAFR